MGASGTSTLASRWLKAWWLRHSKCPTPASRKRDAYERGECSENAATIIRKLGKLGIMNDDGDDENAADGR